MLSKETLFAALEFRREREWQKFHTPLNLALAISVEAGELLEQFQWLLPDALAPTEGQRDAIENEVADIAILLAYFINDLDIDIDAAVRQKLMLNGQRYPIEKSRGNARKYNQL